MKIYVGHSTAIPFRQKLYEPLRNSKIDEEHTLIFPHEDSDEMFDSKSFLCDECDLFIAEVTEASTGLGIELGWADQFGVPIVCVYRSGSDPSSSLKAVTDEIRGYSSSMGLIEIVESVLNRENKVLVNLSFMDLHSVVAFELVATVRARYKLDFLRCFFFDGFRFFRDLLLFLL